MTGKEKHMEYLQAKAKLDDIRAVDVIEGDATSREARFLFRALISMCDALLYAYIKGDPRSLLVEVHCGNAGLVTPAESVIEYYGIIAENPFQQIPFNKMCTKKYSKFTRENNDKRDYLR